MNIDTLKPQDKLPWYISDAEFYDDFIGPRLEILIRERRNLYKTQHDLLLEMQETGADRLEDLSVNTEFIERNECKMKELISYESSEQSLIPYESSDLFLIPHESSRDLEKWNFPRSDDDEEMMLYMHLEKFQERLNEREQDLDEREVQLESKVLAIEKLQRNVEKEKKKVKKAEKIVYKREKMVERREISLEKDKERFDREIERFDREKKKAEENRKMEEKRAFVNRKEFDGDF